MSAKIKAWVTLIIEGRKTISDVPMAYKKEVEVEIEKSLDMARI